MSLSEWCLKPRPFLSWSVNNVRKWWICNIGFPQLSTCHIGSFIHETIVMDHGVTIYRGEAHTLTSLSRATQVGSRSRHCQWVTIDWTIAICCAHRTWPCKTQSHHPCHWHIKAIISCHCRCFLQPMLDTFRRQKLQSIWLENHTCVDNKILQWLTFI